MELKLNGQSKQDLFVLQMTKFKKNGFFVELGSNDPIKINNTYTLETNYNWRGIMVEYDPKFLDEYKVKRPNSIHVISDARYINYFDLFHDNNVPENIDYLQIDLEPGNKSTLDVIEYFDTFIFDKYKFATITFEHDICYSRYEKSSDTIFHTTRERSREILKKYGYVRVFGDVSNAFENGYDWPYEDWYVHPDLVDMEYVNSIVEKNKNNYIDYDKPDNMYLNLDKIIYFHDIEY